MKNWERPDIEDLKIACTEQGKNTSTSFDEIRVDQNGRYWASFSSGADSNPKTDGGIIVH